MCPEQQASDSPTTHMAVVSPLLRTGAKPCLKAGQALQGPRGALLLTCGQRGKALHPAEGLGLHSCPRPHPSYPPYK